MQKKFNMPGSFLRVIPVCLQCSVHNLTSSNSSQRKIPYFEMCLEENVLELPQAVKVVPGEIKPVQILARKV
jgi:hypothetical protein